MYSVTQSLDNWGLINLHPVDSVICFGNIMYWIVIYPVDTVIQPSNNWTRSINALSFLLLLLLIYLHKVKHTSAHIMTPAMAVSIRVTANNDQDFSTASKTRPSLLPSSSLVMYSLPG